MYCVLGNIIGLEVNIERVDFQYTSLKNYLMRRMFSVNFSMLAQNSPGQTDGPTQKSALRETLAGQDLRAILEKAALVTLLIYIYIIIHDHHQFPFTPSRGEDEGVVDKTECVTTTTVFL